jgi:hypothetical protein
MLYYLILHVHCYLDYNFDQDCLKFDELILG